VPAAEDPLGPGRVARVRRYIKEAWPALTPLGARPAGGGAGPQVPPHPGTPWPVYLSPLEDRAAVERRPGVGAVPAAQLDQIALRPLGPAPGPGAAVPARALRGAGGRFNEMYGWDSYFIVLGLVADGEMERARQQTENFFYESSTTGKVLNANRTYYLTASQPPLLSRMVFRAHPDDAAWMMRARRALEATHRYWTSPPHVAGDTGLSRYFDSGTGPAPEVVNGERDAAGLSHYDRVALLPDPPSGCLRRETCTTTASAIA
jgi:alpha,alpha-trehalase